MKIAVCIKQVPDVTSYIEVDPLTGEIEEGDIVYMVNPYDMTALEQGLQIAEQIPDSEINVFSLGPQRAAAALRTCMAMGHIHGAIHLRDTLFESLDKYTMSLVLARAIETEGFDIVLCGRQSIDDNDGQVGAYIAEFLKLPMVSDVSELEVAAGSGKATVQRALERGDREVVECHLPALFTVNMSLNTPRYPSFSHSLEALRQEIVEMNADSLDLRRELAGSRRRVEASEISFPKPRPRNIVLPDSDLPVHERLDFLMGGGMTSKGCQYLEGDPNDVAKKFTDVLAKNGII